MGWEVRAIPATFIIIGSAVALVTALSKVTQRVYHRE